MSMVTRMEVRPGDDEPGPASSVYSHEGKRQEQIDGHLETGLEVSVIFTDAAGTLAALQMAEGLAEQLGAHIRLLMAYEVPYALPLTRPAVPVEFLEGQVRNLACQTRTEVAAQVCLCRDRRSALGALLRPQSLVVVGGRKRWWPTAAQSFAQAIQNDGHRVIFAELR